MQGVPTKCIHSLDDYNFSFYLHTCYYFNRRTIQNVKLFLPTKMNTVTTLVVTAGY